MDIIDHKRWLWWCTMMRHDAPICTWSSYTKCPNKTPERFTFQSSVRPCETKRQSFRCEAKRRIVDSEAQKSRCSPGTEEMQRILRISACDIYLHMIHIWFRYNIFRLNIASREEFLSIRDAGMKWHEMPWNSMKWHEMEWNGMKWNCHW